MILAGIEPVETRPYAMLSKQSRPGCGRIVVKCVDGQSAAVSVEAHSPLRLLVPEPRGEMVISYTSTYGGGLVAGPEEPLPPLTDAMVRAALEGTRR